MSGARARAARRGAGSASVPTMPTGKDQRDQNEGGSKTGKRRCSSPGRAWRNQVMAAGGVEFAIKEEGKSCRARLLRGARDLQREGAARGFSGHFREFWGAICGSLRRILAPAHGWRQRQCRSRMTALEAHPRCSGEDTNLGRARRRSCCHQEGDTLLQDVAGGQGTSSAMPPGWGPWGFPGSFKAQRQA